MPAYTTATMETVKASHQQRIEGSRTRAMPSEACFLLGYAFGFLPSQAVSVHAGMENGAFHMTRQIFHCQHGMAYCHENGTSM